MSSLGSSIRADFPILSRLIGGKRLVYLDNAATTQKPRVVIDAMTRFYEESNANVHRGGYSLGFESSERFSNARQTIASFVNAATADEIVFTKNATEGLNLVAHSLGRGVLKRGDTVVVTLMEHHANFVPWWRLCKDLGLTLRVVGVSREGVLDRDDFARAIATDARIAAFTHCSNVLGTINPVAELVAIAKERGVITVVDGAQAVPHLGVDVRSLGCDFYSFSGHKMCGPSGIGVLYARTPLLDDLPPFLVGGDMISEVCLEEVTWNVPPRKFEAGTPPVAEAIGLAAACEYLRSLGMEQVRAHERELLGVLVDRLSSIGGITLYGTPNLDQRSGVVAFNVDGVHPHDGAAVLDTFGVCVRSGDHCGQPLMKHLGIKGTLRASVYLYNSREDLDIMVEGVKKIKRMFA